MAISKIKLPDNSVQDIHDARGVDTNGSFYFVQGSSSAAGSSTSGSYLSVKWEGTVPGVSAAYNGLKIAYRIATRTGVSGGGVVLSIDNGAHYYPVVIQANSMVTTHYPVGATFLAVFNSTQTATAYLTAGTKSTVTGCWQIMEYDSNTNTYQREYVSSNNVEYPITTRYDTTTGSSYYAEYGRYSENVTLNPSTNKITAAGFKVTNGTSSQFLKADGSVDSTSYGTYSKPSGGIPATDLAAGVLPAGDFFIPIVSTWDDQTEGYSFSTTTTYTELVAAVTANKRIIASISGDWAGDVVMTYVINDSWVELSSIFSDYLGIGNNVPASLYIGDDGDDGLIIGITYPDNTPTRGNYNVVTSDGIYNALQSKYEKPVNGIPATDLASGVIPTTLPASDVYAWAKAATKPSYTASEVGALPDNTVIPTVPTISTNVVSDKTSDTKTSSPKSVYNEIHPAVVTTQPSGGFVPNVLYRLGTLTGSKTFTLASPSDSAIVNHYYWTFTAGSTAPTITWPSGISWFGGSAPTITAGKHYDVSILDNIAVCMEV